MDAIETERLILRDFRTGDAPDLLAYLHRPRASCFFSLRLDDLGAAEAEVERRSKSDEHVAVCLRGADRLIGDLFRVPEPPDTYAVGWNFNAAYGGAGFAFEAARALVAHLFAVKQARRLYAYVLRHAQISVRRSDSGRREAIPLGAHRVILLATLRTNRSVAMEWTGWSLGRFGDRRLDKGGRRCSPALSRMPASACAS
ncbi:GNAT family N-acetyltransferase [Rhodoplanes roseus]|uniref:N-acetyltransferase domain-containing protein n=1 Tax=Rhodoplanes roseus TaxID=29409 RepID=A0A327L0F5_9BRAD|nr:GNAT family protein [Rhodoplanes roseus]RAI43877.1 hypothetical protein CH341_11940 [Rhodoplanes roseus]